MGGINFLGCYNNFKFAALHENWIMLVKLYTDIWDEFDKKHIENNSWSIAVSVLALNQHLKEVV